MPVLRLYRHGLTAGTPPSANSHQRGKRGNVGGWSKSSIRSNTNFLFAVDERELGGVGFAPTLTVRDCPESSDEWHRMRLAFGHRLRRMGLIRQHWLTEWQRRGVPHMHQAIWLPASDEWVMDRGMLAVTIVDHWLEVAAAFGATRSAQRVTLIHDAVGWFKYQSKHAGRGLHHYQRSRAGVPAGWQKTGRMWGRTGVWALRDAMRFEFNIQAYWKFRRVLRSARVADARAQRHCKGKRIRSARSMLACNEKYLSSVRGVREWGEGHQSLRILAWLHDQGFTITQ